MRKYHPRKIEPSEVLLESYRSYQYSYYKSISANPSPIKFTLFSVPQGGAVAKRKNPRQSVLKIEVNLINST
jgi:hypothetical protein